MGHEYQAITVVQVGLALIQEETETCQQEEIDGMRWKGCDLRLKALRVDCELEEDKKKDTCKMAQREVNAGAGLEGIDSVKGETVPVMVETGLAEIAAVETCQV